MSDPFFLVISGPTGVGKTEIVDQLVAQEPNFFEIINCDVGSLYQPLTIGTAKPDYQRHPIKHHLFDLLTEPLDYSVSQFRKMVESTINDIWQRGKIPLIVGGSGFYLASLYFPIEVDPYIGSPPQFDHQSTAQLWQQLFKIDSKRAENIHQNDRYRIVRALALYDAGFLPSETEPQFKPIGRSAVYFITRERTELFGRINGRVNKMIDAGWLEEVQQLPQEWHAFLLRKKLIGYPELISYLGRPDEPLEPVASKIAQRTRAYAKRQLAFWRRLKEKLQGADHEFAHIKKIEEVDLSISPATLYITKLMEQARKFGR